MDRATRRNARIMLPNSPMIPALPVIEETIYPATHETSRGAGSSGESFCQRGALSTRLST